MLRDWRDENGTYSYYPCIKYKIPADPKLDGTDYFIVAESMNYQKMNSIHMNYYCSLTFSCENDQKAFYKIMKDR